MGVTTKKMDPDNAAIFDTLTDRITSAAGLTGLLVRVRQIDHSFLVECVKLFCSALTNTCSLAVGLVPIGTSVGGVTLGIGGTNTKIKSTVAFMGIMPLKVGGAINEVVNIPITDNIVFSSAFTINVGAVAGVHWGAVRVQMDKNGAFSTKVSTADQAYTSEGAAVYALPKADAGFFDCGYLTIEMATGTTFTAITTALTGGNVTAVNYSGTAAGFKNVCTADPGFVAGSLIKGALVTKVADRSLSQAGGLIAVLQTSAGGAALTDAQLDVDIRAWPVDGEVAGF